MPDATLVAAGFVDEPKISVEIVKLRFRGESGEVVSALDLHYGSNDVPAVPKCYDLGWFLLEVGRYEWVDVFVAPPEVCGAVSGGNTCRNAELRMSDGYIRALAPLDVSDGEDFIISVIVDLTREDSFFMDEVGALTALPRILVTENVPPYLAGSAADESVEQADPRED